MSHKVETMAYNKAEKPWHGLGYAVEHDLTPEQMLKAAKLDWTVVKKVGYHEGEGPNVGKLFEMDHQPLLRTSDGAKLDEVTADWNPVQNIEAATFFNDWVAAGEMSMETAGSLEGGRLVWFLAKLKDGAFDLFKGKDVTEAYFLFTNPHRYGWSTSVSLTPVRVVCWNTITLSLNTTGKDKIIKVSHRNKFDADAVKETIGIAKEKLAKYKEMATFLSKKKAKDEDVVSYFTRLFPVTSSKEVSDKKISKSAQQCLDLLDTQPGAEFGKGTWWASFNSATHYMDHKHGQSVDSRLTNSWYGGNKAKKVKALEYAVDFANGKVST